MPFPLQRHLPVTITLTMLFLIVCCQTKSGSATKNIDSSQSMSLEPTMNTLRIRQGELLFKANCNDCHGIFKTDNLLEGVVQRLGENYFKVYLTKQDSLIKAQDKYALNLKAVFGHHTNSHNFDFSEEQLNAIISYLKKYSS